MCVYSKVLSNYPTVMNNVSPPHDISSLSTIYHHPGLSVLMRTTDLWFTLNILCINNWLKLLKKKKNLCDWNERWWGSHQKSLGDTGLYLIVKGSGARGLLAKLIGRPQTRLLAIATARPIAVLVVSTLVIAARVLLHGVGKVSLSGGMPAGLLEDKPNVASPEDKVQKPKDLKKNQSKRLKD